MWEVQWKRKRPILPDDSRIDIVSYYTFIQYFTITYLPPSSNSCMMDVIWCRWLYNWDSLCLTISFSCIFYNFSSLILFFQALAKRIPWRVISEIPQIKVFKIILFIWNYCNSFKIILFYLEIILFDELFCIWNHFVCGVYTTLIWLDKYH